MPLCVVCEAEQEREQKKYSRPFLIWRVYSLVGISNLLKHW